MPALKIALLTSSTRPCGAVVHTLALAEALARAGQQVTVWSLAGGSSGFFRPIDPAVRVGLVPFPDVEGEDVGSRRQRAVALLAAAFAAGPGPATTATAPAATDPTDLGYDVVHTQDWISANAVPGRIQTVHRLEDFTAPDLVADSDRVRLRPAALVCGSAAVAAEFAGEDLEVVVIPNGVESARFAAAAADDPAALEQRRYWTDRFGDFVLAIGGIEPRKGTLDLVRAMARVRRRRPGTRLVIAGGDNGFDPDYRREVDALAVRLRIEPEVLGLVEQARMPSLVAAAGAFASLQEGLGAGAMEALAGGVPVVTRDLPVSREVFADAVRYAEVGDGSSADLSAGLAAQLVAALEGTTDGSTALMRRTGQALAGRHSWDEAAMAHLALYRRLISEGLPVGLPS